MSCTRLLWLYSVRFLNDVTTRVSVFTILYDASIFRVMTDGVNYHIVLYNAIDVQRVLNERFKMSEHCKAVGVIGRHAATL